MKQVFSHERWVAKSLEFTYTTQMIFILSAVINLKASPDEPNTADTFSYTFSWVTILAYIAFVGLVVPYILWTVKLITDNEG